MLRRLPPQTSMDRAYQPIDLTRICSTSMHRLSFSFTTRETWMHIVGLYVFNVYVFLPICKRAMHVGKLQPVTMLAISQMLIYLHTPSRTCLHFLRFKSPLLSAVLSNGVNESLNSQNNMRPRCFWRDLSYKRKLH